MSPVDPFETHQTTNIVQNKKIPTDSHALSNTHQRTSPKTAKNLKHLHQKRKQNKTQKAIQHIDANRVESRARPSIGIMIHSTNIIKADYVDHENEDGRDTRMYLVVGDLS